MEAKTSAREAPSVRAAASRPRKKLQGNGQMPSDVMQPDTVSVMFHALHLLLEPMRLLILFGGVLIGLAIGCIPGLGGVVGLAVLIPFTYNMDAYSAFALLLGMAAVTTSSDLIPAVLFGVPGTVGAAATVIDGHAMARKGEAGRAFGAGFASSLAGGIVGAIILAAAVPVLKPVMLAIGAPELLAFSIFGLSMVATLSGKAPLKGLTVAGIGLMLSMIGTAGYYTAYVFAVWRTVTGVFSFGTLTLLANAIREASSNLQQTFSTLSTIADQALFLTDLIAFFDMKPTIRSKPNALPAPRPIQRGFEFRNVSFRYPGASRLVLNKLNFHLHPGERVALIGENGEGKTTIVKLLTRLYDPLEGQILLDGIDLREYNLEDLYREIGVIFQDFMRYEMTARENIAVGRIEYINDLELLQQSAQKSMADGVVGKLPSRYDQMLGRRFDGGVDLSGGEWQKVALARAYLRDAQLLILDEPTSALDARSEYEVFQRFAELTTGKMAIFISHRFSTVRMADRIVVLENGRIAEEGDHEALTHLGGRYAEMFELQAASYR